MLKKFLLIMMLFCGVLLVSCDEEESFKFKDVNTQNYMEQIYSLSDEKKNEFINNTHNFYSVETIVDQSYAGIYYDFDQNYLELSLNNYGTKGGLQKVDDKVIGYGLFSMINNYPSVQSSYSSLFNTSKSIFIWEFKDMISIQSDLYEVNGLSITYDNNLTSSFKVEILDENSLGNVKFYLESPVTVNISFGSFSSEYTYEEYEIIFTDYRITYANAVYNMSMDYNYGPSVEKMEEKIETTVTYEYNVDYVPAYI